MASLLHFLGQFSNVFQGQLFPALQESLGWLGSTHEKFARTLALLELDAFVTVQYGR